MIEIKNITKTFKTDFWARPFKALDQVSFEIEKGEIIGFLGANGAGKTTLIKILMKLIRADFGEIVFSKDLGRNIQEVFSKFGLFPERPYFYPYLTGKEFLLYMGKLNNVPTELIIKRALMWSERFNIHHAIDRNIRGYSKGMLQRLGFISAVIHDPQVLILDEPLSGLDPVGRQEIKDALVEINKEGKTIFFSSHIVSDVEEICKKVIVLEKGKLLYQGSIDELIEKNIRPNYQIKISSQNEIQYNFEATNISRDMNENHYTYEIKIEDKERFIEETMKAQGKIIYLQLNRPSLERIIYNIRS